MKTKLHVIILILYGILFILIFKNWFITGEIIGGDWGYFSPERLQEVPLIPPAWNSVLANGFGSISPIYSLQIFHHFTITISNIFHISWALTSKIMWFGLFIFLSIFSSIYFLKTVIKDANLSQTLIGSLIFSTNTYVLMMVGGGQMGVALGYAIAPLVLARFIRLIEKLQITQKNIKNNSSHWNAISNSKFALITGVMLAIQVMFDPRIVYITFIAIGLYILITFKLANLLKVFFYACFIPGITVVLLHASWILPSLLFSHNPINTLGSAYSGVGAFKFFSFADFSHSFSLLHPNWPENIFGKTYFLKPEYLLLPIVAYTSLLFINSSKEKNKKSILFLLVLGLIGAFLAKGAQEPFGFINSWLFNHVPGFILFRDPSKFYLLIILSYCILIPFSLGEISKKLARVSYIIFAIFIVFWAFLIRQAILSQLPGTFQKHTIPQEYIAFEKFLSNQSDFSRSLWVPRQQRFDFVSNSHPAIEAEPLLGATNSADTVYILKNNDHMQAYLQNLGVKYVNVPYDSLGEIFLDDRKYDPKQYEATITSLRTIPWLTEKKGFGRLAVFELQNRKKHFWISGEGNISEKMVQPDTYTATISIAHPTTVVFVENYSPYWEMKVDNKIIHSQKTSDGFNSFFISKTGTYTTNVVFVEKTFFQYGWILSCIYFLGIVIFLIFA